MRAGELDKQVDVKQLVSTKTQGVYNEVYSDLMTDWVHVVSREITADADNGQTPGLEKAVIKTRLNPQYAIGVRVVIDGVNFNVVGIKPFKNRQGQELQLLEDKDG